jgi:hypothetical protein
MSENTISAMDGKASTRAHSFRSSGRLTRSNSLVRYRGHNLPYPICGGSTLGFQAHLRQPVGPEVREVPILRAQLARNGSARCRMLFELPVFRPDLAKSLVEFCWIKKRGRADVTRPCVIYTTANALCYFLNSSLCKLHKLMTKLRDELLTLRRIKITPHLHKLLERFFEFFTVGPDCFVTHANKRCDLAIIVLRPFAD